MVYFLINIPIPNNLITRNEILNATNCIISDHPERIGARSIHLILSRQRENQTKMILRVKNEKLEVLYP
jgi:hypothetical protein